MAAADGRLNGIRQAAPMYTFLRAHWRHLANMIELVLHSAHPSPQPKLQIDRFSHFCTAHERSLYFTRGCPFPLQNCSFPLRIWTPCNTLFPGPIRVLNNLCLKYAVCQTQSRYVLLMKVRTFRVVGRAERRAMSSYCELASTD